MWNIEYKINKDYDEKIYKMMEVIWKTQMFRIISILTCGSETSNKVT